MENLVFTQLSVPEVRTMLREEVEAALSDIVVKALASKQPEQQTPKPSKKRA